MLATMFLSQGTPMLLAGDEFGNSQQGNNNAYCQDNPIGWLDWESTDTEMVDFVASLSAFRKAHKSVRQTRFLHGAERPADDHPDVKWTGFDGGALNWRDPGLSSLCLTLRCSAEAPLFELDSDVVFVVFNRENRQAEVNLPLTPAGQHWIRAVDTAAPATVVSCEIGTITVPVEGKSVVAFVLKDNEAAS